MVVIDDKALIEKTLNGDYQAFAELVKRHQDYAYNVALSIAQDPMEAEEIAMDAFVKAHKNLNKFEGSSKFSTWFYRIIVNEALSRKRKKKLPWVDIQGARNVKSSTKYIADSDLQLVHDGIAELSEKDATAITLYYLYESDMKEVADALGMTAANAKVVVHRARKRLATILHERLGDEIIELLH